MLKLVEDLDNVKLTENYIYDRKVFRNSFKFDGKTIFELNNEGKEKRDLSAENEMLKFFNEVYDV